MAAHQINIGNAALKTSLDQLLAVTDASYNDAIRPVATKLWKKHLHPDNPQWEFITVQPFYESNDDGSAHVMAMTDSRLPHIGMVGYFACTDSSVGAQVLLRATQWLKDAHGRCDIYGPINGTLPSDYRLNMSDDYAFPGEPVNPTWHIDAFTDAGFTVFNNYASARLKHYNTVLKLLLIKKPKTKDVASIAVRPFNNDDFDKDFKTYHDLRNDIFPLQSIYCPVVSLAERTYNATGKFDPGYTYFLTDKTDDNREVGFIMAYAHEGDLILKTIGLLPEYRGKRLSNLLLQPVHDKAHQDGLQSVIYGMVRVGNSVHTNRHPGAKIFRTYVTMHKKI